MLKRLTTAIALLAATTPALAQRTDINVVTQADDAFGTSVGDENIGLYNADDVRGFSPVEAGNIRIEGLYFDQQANPTDRLIFGSAIRVGISALGYPFPAPTGIADYELRRAGKDPLLSAAVNYGPFGGRSVEADVQLPIDGDRLGIAAGSGIYREVRDNGASPNFFTAAVLGRYAPRTGVEIIPFWSRIRVTDEEAASLIFSSGDFLPKRIARGKFFGQPWATFDGTFYNSGVIAKADPLGLAINAGVFRSVSRIGDDFGDLLFDTDADGRVGRRVVVAQRGDRFASTSGEVRVTRSISDGPRRHNIIASVRARALRRQFGGGDVVELGVSQTGTQAFRSPPALSFGAKTFDTIDQSTLSVGYQGTWKGVGEIGIGIQKTDYRRASVDPDPAIVIPRTVSRPWLPTANVAITVSPAIAIYGGFARGLEESPVAPSNAVNINEAPPAIQTRQIDGGVRWKIAPKLTLVAGLFDIQKPYFNLDPVNRFRQLGTVTNRGIELSLSGEILPHLTTVAGLILLDARVSGEEVRAGLIGERPVGLIKRRGQISFNYDLPAVPGLALNTAIFSTSSRTANLANSFVIPPRSVMSLGARYQIKAGKVPLLARVSVENIANTFGWNVGSSGFFTANGPRRFSLSLAADI